MRNILIQQCASCRKISTIIAANLKLSLPDPVITARKRTVGRTEQHIFETGRQEQRKRQRRK